MSDSMQFEVHDREVLANARSIMSTTESPRQWAQAVIDAVKRNEEWGGERCINLLAPEAPTSPMVRALLSSEIGTRAAEGNIGRVNRWFAGTQHIDEVEALCVELLKVAFRCNYADHRLMGSMLGNMTVYHALTQPGDVIMSAPHPFAIYSVSLDKKLKSFEIVFKELEIVSNNYLTQKNDFNLICVLRTDGLRKSPNLN